MRDIMFRGRRSDGEWLYGDLARRGRSSYITPLKSTKARFTPENEVDPATVGQFTGLYDKQDTPIYEGDILSGKLGKFRVDYVEHCTSFMAHAVSYANWSPGLNRGTMRHYLVLGNVHDEKDNAV